MACFVGTPAAAIVAGRAFDTRRAPAGDEQAMFPTRISSRRRIGLLLASWIVALAVTTTAGLALAAGGTQVVVLGTGTPLPNYKRAGAGVAVIHGDDAYLFDAGGGTYQRAIEAYTRLGIGGLAPARLCCVFFTHLHSDHTHDYSQFATSRWWAREFKLKAFGPRGLQTLTDGMHAMTDVDVQIRLKTQPSESIIDPANARVEVKEIEEGIVFSKGDLTIEAFAVRHGKVEPAFGYRIVTADRKIVISGDTTFSEKLVEKAAGVDVLVHEVVSARGLERFPVAWSAYQRTSHTTTDQLATIARRARPKLLVLYHVIFLGESPESLLEAVRTGHSVEVVLPDDLDVF